MGSYRIEASAIKYLRKHPRATISGLAKFLKCTRKVASSVYAGIESNEEYIEHLYKVEPPLLPSETGYGFSGVIRWNCVIDKLQCHICGKWYSSLQTHVSTSGGHGIEVRKYKEEFGLPLSAPLISRELSAIRSRTALNAKNLAMLASRRNPIQASKAKQAPTERMKKIRKYVRNNASFSNKIGSCKLQMERRFLIVADQVGREPTATDILKYDPKLLGLIKHRGTLNEYRKSLGLQEKYLAPHCEDDYIVSQIRLMGTKMGRVPLAKDFQIGSPNIRTIRRHFGSWNRALSTSGYDYKK